MSRLSRVFRAIGHGHVEARARRRGVKLASDGHDEAAAPAADQESGVPTDNPLWDYFAAHTEGPGIWKWKHYFDVYHHYFRRFVGRPAAFADLAPPSHFRSASGVSGGIHWGVLLAAVRLDR